MSHGDVPRQDLISTLPRYQRQPVGSLAILSRQPDELLGDWDASGHKRPRDDIVQGLVPGDSTGSSFTNGVRTMGVDLSTTEACVWNGTLLLSNRRPTAT